MIKRLQQVMLVFFCLCILFLPQEVFSAQPLPWVVPSNIRVVQQDNTTGDRVFATISDALQNIGPTPTGHFSIQVMPGTYTENNLVLPSNVDITGYGKDVTTILTAGVTLNNGSILQNLTLQGTSSTLIGVNQNAEVNLRDVLLKIPGNLQIHGTVEGQAGSTINFVNSQIEILDAGVNATYVFRANPDTVLNIIDSHIMLQYRTWQHAYLIGGGGGNHKVNIIGSSISINNNDQANAGAVEFFDSLDGDLAIKNSEINLVGITHAEAIYAGGGSKVEVNNSKINVISSSTNNNDNLSFIDSWMGGKIYVNNSSIKIFGQNQNQRFIRSAGGGNEYWRTAVEINNSEIIGAIEVSFGDVKIGNSKYVGGFDLISPEYSTYTSINCYNENFQMYPNN